MNRQGPLFINMLILSHEVKSIVESVYILPNKNFHKLIVYE